MPGHLSAACQTSRQHKCENASTLCSGIKPRQRSAGRPPPGPQTSPWPRSWLRTGRPSEPVERGASALAQVVAQDRAPVCPGGPGGKATWPRSGPRTGRPSAPVDRGARRPGPGRGPGPGARLPRCRGGQGDLAQVGAQDRAPVCPGGPGGKATWPRSGPRTGRPSAPVDRGARRPGPGRGPGPGAGLPRWTGGQGDLAQVGAQDRAPVCPGVPGGKATWPRSGPRTGRRSAPVDRGARRPGPGRGPGPGARLPRWTGGQGDLAQVGAQDRAPVCPGGPGGKATWPRSGPRTGRPSAPVEREGRRACVSGGACGAGTYSMGDHVREVVQIFRGGVRASAIPGYMGARRAACSRALVHLEGVRGSRCQCRGQAGRASTSPGEAGRGRASAGEPGRGRARPGGGRASASLSICWPGRGGRRSAGAGCAGRDANVRGQAGRASTSPSEAGRGRAGPA